MVPKHVRSTVAEKCEKEQDVTLQLSDAYMLFELS